MQAVSSIAYFVLAKLINTNCGGKMSHLLIEKAFKYKIPSQKTALFKEYTYNNVKGYWINDRTGKPLMSEDNEFRPKTKKEDVETGEDKKGE